MYLSLIPCKDSQKFAIYTDNTVFLVKLSLKNIEPRINGYISTFLFHWISLTRYTTTGKWSL